MQIFELIDKKYMGKSKWGAKRKTQFINKSAEIMRKIFKDSKI